MAKLVVLALCAVVVLAEPPSSYLPPQARNGPSSTYGAPNGGNGGFGGFQSNGKAASFSSQRIGSNSFSYNSLHENQFNGGAKKSFGSAKSFGNGFNGVSQQYGAPSQNGFGLSQRYGAPSFGGNGNGNGNGFGAHSNGFGASNGISQRYGAPSFGGNGNGNGFGASNGISQRYGAPSFGGNGNGNGFGASNGISQRYGAPSFNGNGNGFKNGNGNGFKKANGFKNGNGFGASNGFGVSQQYGAPSFDAKFGGSSFGAPAPVYGAPSSRYGAPYSKMDDDLSEPANYEYTYEVQAAEESGAEFGHQESREDESARGVYHVLLPDGRTQIVEYEADEEGFRPVIRYEEPTGPYPAARGQQGPQGPY